VVDISYTSFSYHSTELTTVANWITQRDKQRAFRLNRQRLLQAALRTPPHVKRRKMVAIGAYSGALDARWRIKALKITTTCVDWLFELRLPITANVIEIHCLLVWFKVVPQTKMKTRCQYKVRISITL
jgi:hypothetical protein